MDHLLEAFLSLFIIPLIGGFLSVAGISSQEDLSRQGWSKVSTAKKIVHCGLLGGPVTPNPLPEGRVRVVWVHCNIDGTMKWRELDPKPEARAERAGFSISPSPANPQSSPEVGYSKR